MVLAVGITTMYKNLSMEIGMNKGEVIYVSNDFRRQKRVNRNL